MLDQFADGEAGVAVLLVIPPAAARLLAPVAVVMGELAHGGVHLLGGHDSHPVLVTRRSGSSGGSATVSAAAFTAAILHSRFMAVVSTFQTRSERTTPRMASSVSTPWWTSRPRIRLSCGGSQRGVGA